MESIHNFMIILVLIGVLSAYQCKAQSTGGSSTPARSLDALLQGYAYKALNHPRTGRPFDGKVPFNLTGIKISALRLRSGSLYNKGVPSYKEFQIPKGVIMHPYVKRLVFVYQNLGDLSDIYYRLPPGFTYLTPVLGLLAYDAANLFATHLPELGVVVSQSQILINFTNVKPVPSGLSAICVYFNLDGVPAFRDLESSNICSTYRQGHFSIVVNASGIAPSPAPSEVPSPTYGKSNKSKVWKIVGAAVGGFIALVLLALLVAWMCRYGQKRKVAEMERRADVGEALHMARVGDTQAPVASGTRTQPVLENEYVAGVVA